MFACVREVVPHFEHMTSHSTLNAWSELKGNLTSSEFYGRSLLNVQTGFCGFSEEIFQVMHSCCRKALLKEMPNIYCSKLRHFLRLSQLFMSACKLVVFHLKVKFLYTSNDNL